MKFYQIGKRLTFIENFLKQNHINLTILASFLSIKSKQNILTKF